MTDDEFVSWREHSTLTYAAVRAAELDLDPDETLRGARAQSEALLPDGRATAGHHFLCVVDAGDVVGWLWIGPHPDKPDAAWIWEIEVVAEAQGRGVGRAAMLAAEELVAAEGAGALGLNVFGSNERAVALYESLGYSVVSMTMIKALGDRP